MSEVTLRVTNTDAGRPGRVQVFDTRHKLHGDVVLGPGRDTHDFTVPRGPYIIQVERAGARPEQILRVLEKNQELDIVDSSHVVSQEGVEQREHVQAALLRARRGGMAGSLEVQSRVPGTRDLGQLDSDYLSSVLAQYTGRRRAAVNAEGAGVTRERSGFRLPERSEESSGVDKAARRRAKLRSRFRLTLADHARIAVKIRLDVEDANNVPGDMLKLWTGNFSARENVEIDAGYRAPLLWLQERKSDVTEASFIAVPLFRRGLALGFDADNAHVVRVESGNTGMDALLGLLAASISVNADAVAEQVFEGADVYSDGMDQDMLAYRLLRDKFFDPYAAAVAGYFMVRFNKFELLRDWSRNLADYFPFMTDGCIIEGWRRLIVRGDSANPPWPSWRVKDPPPGSPLNERPNTKRSDDPITDAARRFLEAHARGLPTFYFGLEKHLEGLTFCFDRTNDNDLKGRLRLAIGDISNAANRAYSSAGLTTLAAFG